MSYLKKTEHPGFFIKEFAHGFQSYKTDEEPLVFSATHHECKYWTDQVLKAKQEGGWDKPTTFTPFIG